MWYLKCSSAHQELVHRYYLAHDGTMSLCSPCYLHVKAGLPQLPDYTYIPHANKAYFQVGTLVIPEAVHKRVTDLAQQWGIRLSDAAGNNSVEGVAATARPAAAAAAPRWNAQTRRHNHSPDQDDDLGGGNDMNRMWPTTWGIAFLVPQVILVHGSHQCHTCLSCHNVRPMLIIYDSSCHEFHVRTAL